MIVISTIILNKYTHILNNSYIKDIYLYIPSITQEDYIFYLLTLSFMVTLIFGYFVYGRIDNIF